MVNNHKNIAIIGAGYVGLSSAALLSNCGYKVYLIELNQKRLQIIKSGSSFFYEQGIDKLINKAISNETLVPSDDYSLLSTCKFVFSCVGTPDNPDGSSNLSFVYSAAKSAANYMRPKAFFIQKSTVPVGTGAKIKNIFSKLGKNFIYVSNPEFLREGTAIADTLYFDRIVCGSDDDKANKAVFSIYKTLHDHSTSLAKIAGLKIKPSSNGQYISTSVESAELIKVTANAFLALKISFANSIAKLADKVGADVVDVMDGVGQDARIGRAFLNAGRGYGGGCFPKDVSGLISSATDHGVDLGIMTAAADLNETMPGYIANKAQKVLGDLRNKKVAVLGLSFKAGTSDARKSPGVKLANILSKNGSKVFAYDPKANGEAKEDLRKSVSVTNSYLEAANNVDAVFVMTDWPVFLRIQLVELKKVMSGDVFVDAVNSFDKHKVETSGFRYIGVGR